MTAAFLASWVNFLALVGFLGWKLRAPAKAFVSGRASGLREELGQVREQLSTAKATYDEYSAKLKAIEAELRAVREEAAQQAKASQSRVMGEAQRLSSQIVSDARAASTAAADGLKRRMASEFGVRIVETAEKLLREKMTGDDRARIRQEFSRMVESVQ